MTARTEVPCRRYFPVAGRRALEILGLCAAIGCSDGAAKSDGDARAGGHPGLGGSSGAGAMGDASATSGGGATAGIAGVGMGGATPAPGGSPNAGGAGTGDGGSGNAGGGISNAGAGNGGAGSRGDGGAGGSAPGPTTEDDGADCAVASLPDSGSLPPIAKLPDPFERLDGTRIANKADWRCRREELRKQAEKYAYGTKPPRPQSVTGTISSTSISVKVTDNGRSTSFSAKVVLPGTGTPPYPVLIVYGGLGLGFGVPLDGNVINSENVALIDYDVGVTGKEGTPRNNKQGAFYDIAGSNSTAGLLVAWAWGVSRMIDVIEQSDGKILEAGAVAVTGCSRFGKGAFAAGVFDQRIPLTIPIESGTGGVPIWRGIPGENGAQTLSSAYGEQPWFGDAFGVFTSDPAKAPIDTHESVAMIAPRGLLILDNPFVAHLGAKSGHVGALAGAEVYKALGAADNITYYSDVQNGTHCSMRPEWSAPFRSAVRRFLNGTGNDPGVFKPAANATGRLSDWVDWTTPTLK